MKIQNIISCIFSSIYPSSSKTSDNHTINSSASFKQASPTISSEKGRETRRSFFSSIVSWFGYNNRSHYSNQTGGQERDYREAVKSLAKSKIEAIQIMDKELQGNSESVNLPNSNLKKFQEKATAIEKKILQSPSQIELESIKNKISSVASEAYEVFKKIKTEQIVQPEQIGQISSASSNQENPVFNIAANNFIDSLNVINRLDPQDREGMLAGISVLAESARNNAQNLLEPFNDILHQEGDGFLRIGEENKMLSQQEAPTEDQSRAVWQRFTQAIQAQFGDELPEHFLDHEPNSSLTLHQAKKIILECDASVGRIAALLPLQSGLFSTNGEDPLRCRTQAEFEMLSAEEQRCLEELTKTGKELLKTPGDLIKIGMLLKGYSVGPAVTTAAAHLGAPLATGALGTALLPIGALGFGIVAGVAAGWAVGYATTYWDAKVDEALSPQSNENALTGAHAATNIAYHTTIGTTLGESVQHTFVGSLLDHAIGATGIPYSEALNHELFLLAGYYASEAASQKIGSDFTRDAIHAIDSNRRLLGVTNADNLHEAHDSVENQNRFNDEITEGVGFESRTFKIANRVVSFASMPGQFTDYISARYLASKSRIEMTYANELESQSQSDGALPYEPGLRSTLQELSYQNVLSDIKNHYQKLKNSRPSSDPIESYVQERLAELKAIYCVMCYYEHHPEMQTRITRIACEAYQRVLHAKEKVVDPTGSSSGLYVINLYPYAADIPYTVPESP